MPGWAACPWNDLHPSAKVGTSSVLRQQQILQMRPDVSIVEYPREHR